MHHSVSIPNKSKIGANITPAPLTPIFSMLLPFFNAFQENLGICRPKLDPIPMELSRGSTCPRGGVFRVQKKPGDGIGNNNDWGQGQTCSFTQMQRLRFLLQF